MPNKLADFLEKNSVVYPLEFTFGGNYYTKYILIHLTSLIPESLNKGEFSCWIFVDLQKVLDTVDHKFLPSKLDHYRIRGVANKWFKTYLYNKNSMCLLMVLNLISTYWRVEFRRFLS